MVYSCRSCLTVTVVALLLLTAPRAGLALMVAPVSVQVRHDVQFLTDRGLLPGHLSTWPISRAGLSSALDAVPQRELVRRGAAVRAAHRRMRAHLDHQAGFSGAIGVRGVAGEATPPENLAWFGASDPTGSEALAEVGYGGERVAVRVRGEAVEDPADDRTYRMDGSYVAATLGNWTAAFGAIPAWWGPGWSGSLILGTASRPIQGLHLIRNEPRAFTVPLLRYLGPWTFHAFYGQLESGRHVSRPDIMGARLAFRPWHRLEIGLSRTAIWGGDASPRTWQGFGEILIGDSNRREQDVKANQLAGFDFRLAFADQRQPWAIYAQAIGDDESDGIPTKYIGMAGIETWGLTGIGSNYRLFVEASNTTWRFHQPGSKREKGEDSRNNYNGAYEHSVFRTGYRYRERPIGYPTDNDSLLLTIGAIFLSASDRQTTILLRGGNLNRNDDNRPLPGGNRITRRAVDLLDVDVDHRWPLWGGTASAGAGLAWVDEAGSGDTFEPRASVGWDRRF